MKSWIILKSRNCNICYKSYEYDSRQTNPKYCSNSCRSLANSQKKICGLEGIDYVICKICGFKFKEINNDHISKHNMTCDEYDEMFNSSRTCEKTRLKKNTLSSIMDDEMSKKLSKSHTIEGYINKYGLEKGHILYNKMIENKTYRNGKQSYIDKYGLEKGEEIYNDIQKKKVITLEKCIDRYGEEEGVTRYEEWKKSQKNKNLLSSYIERHGYDMGLIKWLDKNNKISIANSKIQIEHKNKFKEYICEVDKYTRLSIGNKKLYNIELRGFEFGYDLDHRFSKIDGFKNNIPSYIIGHISNLKIVDSSYNRKKQHNSDIDVEFIIKEFENDIEYKKIVTDIEKLKNNKND